MATFSFKLSAPAGYRTALGSMPPRNGDYLGKKKRGYV